MSHGCPDCGDRLCPGHGAGGCAAPDPRDATIATLREHVRVLRERAKLLVGECEEQRECPVCGTDTNVEVCRPSCYVAKMRNALALTEPKL